MSMRVLVPQECTGQKRSDVLPIPKKKWILNYYLLGERDFGDVPSNSSSTPVTVTTQTPSQISSLRCTSNQIGAQRNGHCFNDNLVSNGVSKLGFVAPPRVLEVVNDIKPCDLSIRRVRISNQLPCDLTSAQGNKQNRSNKGAAGPNHRNPGTREVHNKLEKNRRAHLKECFELLKSQLPAVEDHKISNLAILRSSLRHIQNLQRKEREYEHEMERLTQENVFLQQRFSQLQKDVLHKLGHMQWPEAVMKEEADDSCHESDYPQMHNANSFRAASHESRSLASVATLPSKRELEDSARFQHPVSLTVSNCHIGKKLTVNKVFGQINGMNGVSGSGPVSLVTTGKSPLR